MKTLLLGVTAIMVITAPTYAEKYDPRWLESEFNRCVAESGMSRDACKKTVYDAANLTPQERYLKAYSEKMDFERSREEKSKKAISDIPDLLAEDEAEKYEIVSATLGGSEIDICVQAGITAQAFLQAKNIERYGKWKETERDDCRRAGVR